MAALSLDIHDIHEFPCKARSQNANALPYCGIELLGRRYISATTGFHRYLAAWILHGCRKQSRYLIFRNIISCFLCGIFRIYIPTSYQIHEITSAEIARVGYQQLNQAYLGLQQNCTGLQNGLNELDNTRRVAVILGITAAFFVVTTVFTVICRSKEPSRRSRKKPDAQR